MTDSVSVAEEVVELRCPNGWPDATLPGGCRPGKLFAQLRMSGEKPSFIHPDNLIVMACGDCKRFARRKGIEVGRVLHCYDMAGTLVRTLYEDDPDVAEDQAGD